MRGPINTGSSSKSSTNFISSHTLKIVVENNEDKILSEEVKNVWKLETIGIYDDEKSVYQKFQEDIKFENDRYVVKLPLKES